VKKRKFIFIIGLVFFSLTLNAAPISESTAKTVALNFLRNRTSSEILRKAKSVKLIYKYCDSLSTYIYVFNVNPIGFIVISGDNRTMPVLSYSDESSYDTSMINKSAEERYANLIDTNNEIFQFAQLKHIASYLGMTDTSLSRIRKEFMKK
jgi:hypothetical protein